MRVRACIASTALGVVGALAYGCGGDGEHLEPTSSASGTSSTGSGEGGGASSGSAGSAGSGGGASSSGEGGAGGAGVGGGGGGGGGGASAMYSDLAASNVEYFDLSAKGAAVKGYWGGAFDGQHVYFTPATLTAPEVRYDTQAAFAAQGSWQTYKLTNAADGNASAKGYLGCVFDGKALYNVPFSATGAAPFTGVVARYDPALPFDNANGAPGWTYYNAKGALGATASGFASAVEDGRYIYFAPWSNGTSGTVWRYDTQGALNAAGSWSSFNFSTLEPKAKGYAGGVFDGRYVYFVPIYNAAAAVHQHGFVARYDTQSDFTQAAAWSIYDIAANVDQNANGFGGGAFDGRFLYLVPFKHKAAANAGTSSGLAVRYDTQASFAAGASWEKFDVSTVNAAAIGFYSAAFDGRFIYYTPNSGDSGFHGVVARYDTTAGFADPAAWGTLDLAAGNPGAKGFVGAVFDGSYVYFVPSDASVATRFFARTPAAMPPGYRGSFL